MLCSCARNWSVVFWWLDFVGGGGGEATDLGVRGIAGVVKYVAKQEAKAVAREVVRSAASQVWKDLKAWRGKIKTNGLSGKGRRYFTYDPEGEIEVFNRRGQHWGAMDPNTGAMIPGSNVPGRTIDVR